MGSRQKTSRTEVSKKALEPSSANEEDAPKAGDLLSALDAFSKAEGLDEYDDDDIDLDEEDDYSDLRPISEWKGDDEDDEDEDASSSEDSFGIRGLLESDDGLGDMFFQALLSARKGDLEDADTFANKLVEVFNETPRKALGGQSPDVAFDEMRKPKSKGRDRSPLGGKGKARDSL